MTRAQIDVPLRLWAAAVLLGIGGVALVRYTVIMTVPLVTHPDPMFGLEMLVSGLLLASGIGAVAAALGLMKGAEWGRYVGLAVAVLLLLFSGLMILPQLGSLGGYGPPLIDPLMWVLAVAGLLLLALVMKPAARMTDLIERDEPGHTRSVFAGGAAWGPSALVTLTAVLVLVFATNPVRPYTKGEWAANDLIALVVIGVLAGLVGRRLWGWSGVVLGMTAAVAFQLFVLTGQASWDPSVVSNLQQPRFAPAIALSLVVGLTAITVGYALTWTVRWLAIKASGHPGMRTTTKEALIAATASFGGAVVVGLLLMDASTSAYAKPPNQPNLQIVVHADAFVTVEPATIEAGRIDLTAGRTDPTDAGVFVTSRLPPEQLTACSA